jgi:hypothetical protein
VAVVEEVILQEQVDQVVLEEVEQVVMQFQEEEVEHQE